MIAAIRNLIEANTLLSFLQTRTDATGSAEYGMPNPSDHDRFCSQDTMKELTALLEKNNIQHESKGSGGESANSITFDYAGTRFNVFVVPAEELHAVRCVTQMVKVAAGYFPNEIQNKALRVHMFRTLRDTLGMWVKVQKGVAQ